MKNNILTLALLVFQVSCTTSPETPKTNQPSKPYTEQTQDSLLKTQLEHIATTDQTLRLLLPDVTKRFGKDSSEEKYIWSLIHQQDSISLLKLQKIITRQGWLGKSRVGDKANQAQWLVIQHAALEVQLRYLPLLKQSVSQDESEGWHLAFLEDRILMYQKKKQKYGTQAIWDESLEQFKIHPIEDVENVDARRTALGLETMDRYTQKNGYWFDPSNE